MGLKDRIKDALLGKKTKPMVKRGFQIDVEGRLVEAYDIEKGFSKVEILFDDENDEYFYKVIEPELSDRDLYILEFIKDTMLKTIHVDIEKAENKVETLWEIFQKIITDYDINADSRIFYYIRRDFIEYGKITVLMKDPLLEDISCDGPYIPVYVYHKNYEHLKTNIVFEEYELDSFVIKLAQKAGKHISVADPILDAALPDGSRLQATYGREVTASGSTFTIRKFQEIPFTVLDLIKYNTINPQMAAYYWLMVENKMNIVFAGGTASGKTTMLNAICLFIPFNVKIVSIEDTREVSLPHPNWIKSVTREGSGEIVGGRRIGEVDMYDLLRAALRQRPEYIIVGEIRGKEAVVAFQAMATGHVVYTTMHADSVSSVIHRLESEPINIPRILIQNLHVVSIQKMLSLGGKRQRKVDEIAEIIGIDPATKDVLVNTVFKYDESINDFIFSGRSYLLENIAKVKGVSVEEIFEEMENRARVLQWMMHKGVSYDEFTVIVNKYYKNKESIMEEVNALETYSGGDYEDIR
ncbi:Type IV secretory pathway, VirB11 component [Archaeoglobus sulfaticallidus PM70-1]|uniref:Type IV secretory pathway, VirB11 component n=1 Tax=Archaeoglobus sulfaticallidus PM70-1 TaxID=387631 RepID=N0BII5_9EURY|nr:type II/IV secretion system ATPase subunit [Archaeoglobus sulfaticallidus]AGK60281.1 Type IV secretory pathway, VirB11 component [Archaeoglobus sulfaticallidus PM70-1]